MLNGFEQVVEVAGCRDNKIEQRVDILTPNNGYTQYCLLRPKEKRGAFRECVE